MYFSEIFRWETPLISWTVTAGAVVGVGGRLVIDERLGSDDAELRGV